MRKATEERAQALPAVMAVQTRNARQQQQQHQEKEYLATYTSGASIIPCGEILSNNFDMFVVIPPRHKQTRIHVCCYPTRHKQTRRHVCC